jgi:hypothetical protein
MKVKIPQVSEFNRFRIDELMSSYDSLRPIDAGVEEMLLWMDLAAALFRDLRDAEHEWDLTVGGSGGGGGTPNPGTTIER